MKSRCFWKWTLGLSLSVLPFAGGCLQESQPSSGQSAAGVTGPEVVYQATPAAAVTPEAPPLTNLVEAVVEPISTNQPPPAKVTLTPSAAELVKLAGSGVGEQVMLTFVTNSPSTFNLGAEEIIYLNDLGVPGTVITAMIQRDQALKAAGAAAMAASAQANTPQAIAPAQEPAPADVAPQANAPAAPPAESPAPAPEGDVTTATFYTGLAPYGTWVSVSGYGNCWRPTIAVVNAGWSPYCDGGRWVYTDCGWYWASDYSWGWAPFHYGRWFRHQSWGWCWAPDTVWGPSWVSWRYSSAYCGWAPLPPGAYFTVGIGLTYYGRHCNDWNDMGMGYGHGHYVAWKNFDGRGLRAHAVGVHARQAVYRDTVVVNNITVNNNVVINRGVPGERVASVTQRNIRPVTIRDTTTEGGRPAGGRAEQLRGDTLTVYRPAMPKGNSAAVRTAGAGGTRARPEGRDRTSANSAPAAEGSPASGLAGSTGDRSSRPVAGQTRTVTSGSRDRQPAVVSSGNGSTAAPQSPAGAPPETRVAPVTRRLDTPTANSAEPAMRPVPPPSRAPQAAPTRAPTVSRAPQPAPSQPPTTASSRSGDSTSRAGQPPAPAPTYPAPQRSYTAPSSTTPQRVSPAPSSGQREVTVTPRQSPTVVQVPRAAPAQPTYSPPAQRAPSPAPSYSRPAPSVAPAPRPAAPAAVAPSAPPPPPRPAPAPAPPAPKNNNGQGGKQR